jgi:hypothetical protein
LDFVCARSEVTVLVPATPKARCAAPREALCGVQTWYVASTREAATKGTDTGQKVRCERAALEFSEDAEDAENALRARMPEERMMISLFKMLVETLYGRRPLKPAARPQEFAAYVSPYGSAA